MFFTSRWFVVPALLSAFLTAPAARAASFEDGFRVIETQALTQSRSGQNLLEDQPLSAVLHPSRKVVDARGNEILTYAKYVGSRPVFGEQSAVVFPRSGTPFAVQSPEASRQELVELAGLSRNEPHAVVTLEAAQAVATRDIRQRGSFVDSTVPAAWLSEPELVMYRDAAGALRLCHHLTLPVRERGMPTTRDVFVDAASGAIVAAYSQLYDISRGEEVTSGTGIGLMSDEVKEIPVAAHQGQYRLFDSGRNVAISHTELDTFSVDADHNWDSVGTDRPTNQRAEVELYLNFMRIVDYYKARFGFVWEGTVNAVAHVPNPQTGEPNFNNAFFHPWYNAFFFGDGSATEGGFDYLGKALDVAGHEFGHGFINKEGPLAYSGESGALNEHIADLFGACIDDDDWLIGDDITVGVSAGKGLRNMQDPASGHPELITAGMTYTKWRALNRPRPMGTHIYPDHVSRKIVCTSSEDNGGVHLNSSIFNKFAYLAATGDGLGSEGLGRQLLADVYVKAMTADLYGQSATFAQFRDALLAAAQLQLDGNPKKDEFLKTLRAAFTQIGL